MNSSTKDPVETALSQLLETLAAVLIPLEITPARLSQIARATFVKVSAAQARMRSSGRPHLARIAALTGLPRSEVKRIVAANFRVPEGNSECSPRALRVLRGWQKSSLYAQGTKPRALRIEGKAPSFDSLCREFSGDIPRRVILDELERQQRIVFTHRRSRVMIAPSQRRVRSMQSELLALGFAAAFLADALNKDAILVRRKDRIITSREFADAYVEHAVSGRLTDLLDQLPLLYQGKRRPRRHILNSYALVVRTRAAERKNTKGA